MFYIYFFFNFFFNLIYYTIYYKHYIIFKLYKELKNSSLINVFYLKFLILNFYCLFILRLFLFNLYYVKYIYDLIFLILLKLKLLKIFNCYMFVLQFNFCIITQIKLLKYNKIIELNLVKQLKDSYNIFFFQFFLKYQLYYIIFFFVELYIRLIYNFFYYIYLFFITLNNEKASYKLYLNFFFKKNLSYFYLDLKYYIENKKNWKRYKITNWKMLSNFWYYRSKRILTTNFETLFIQMKTYIKYKIILFYSLYLESLCFVILKSGYNKFIYYFFLIFKYIKSIILYIWKSDIIYYILKALERKKW